MAYCVSLTTRRHGVYIKREEVEKKFHEEDPPKPLRELNAFLAEKKLEASLINISIEESIKLYYRIADMQNKLLFY